MSLRLQRESHTSLALYQHHCRSGGMYTCLQKYTFNSQLCEALQEHNDTAHFGRTNAAWCSSQRMQGPHSGQGTICPDRSQHPAQHIQQSWPQKVPPARQVPSLTTCGHTSFCKPVLGQGDVLLAPLLHKSAIPGSRVRMQI